MKTPLSRRDVLKLLAAGGVAAALPAGEADARALLGHPVPGWVAGQMTGADWFAGDNLAYGLGHRYGAGVQKRFFDGEKSAKRLDWAKGQLDRRGGELILVARFIPGGRTAVTLTAGLTHFPWPRFAVFDAIAAVIWASYASLLGYFGGKAFEGEAWKGLLLALVVAVAVSLAIEVVRWALGRRQGSRVS